MTKQAHTTEVIKTICLLTEKKFVFVSKKFQFLVVFLELV